MQDKKSSTLKKTSSCPKGAPEKMLKKSASHHSISPTCNLSLTLSPSSRLNLKHSLSISEQREGGAKHSPSPSQGVSASAAPTLRACSHLNNELKANPHPLACFPSSRRTSALAVVHVGWRVHCSDPSRKHLDCNWRMTKTIRHSSTRSSQVRRKLRMLQKDF